MKSIRIAAIIVLSVLSLGICGQANAQTKQVEVKPFVKGTLKPITLVCPVGWRLASGNAHSAYTCKRVAAPKCAPGYRVKMGECNNLASGAACAYQCLPEEPNAKPKCAAHFVPIVTPCSVSCTREIR